MRQMKSNMDFAAFVGRRGSIINEPRSEKTGLQGFRLGPTQTGLCNHRRWLEA